VGVRRCVFLIVAGLFGVFGRALLGRFGVPFVFIFFRPQSSRPPHFFSLRQVTGQFFTLLGEKQQPSTRSSLGTRRVTTSLHGSPVRLPCIGKAHQPFLKVTAHTFQVAFDCSVFNFSHFFCLFCFFSQRKLFFLSDNGQAQNGCTMTLEGTSMDPSGNKPRSCSKYNGKKRVK